MHTGRLPKALKLATLAVPLLLVLGYVALDQLLLHRLEARQQEYLSVQTLYSPLAPEQNALTYYLHAVDVEEQCLAGAGLPRSPVQIVEPLLQQAFSGTAPGLSRDERDLLDRGLAACGEVWTHLEQADVVADFRMSTLMQYPHETTPRQMEEVVAIIHELDGLHGAADLLLARAYQDALRQDGAAACRSILMALRITERLGEGPLLTNAALRMNIARDLLAAVRLIHELTPLPADCRDSLMRGVRKLRHPARIANQLATERDFFLAYTLPELRTDFPESVAEAAALLRRPWRALSVLHEVDQFNDFIRAVAEPVPEARLDRYAEANGTWLGVFKAARPPYWVFIEKFEQVAVQSRLVETLINVLRYQEQFGRIPVWVKMVSDVDPEMPENVQLEDFLLQPKDEGFLLRYNGPLEQLEAPPAIMWQG
ncbi:MAG: hypothetical protein HYZ00_11860 [Candidatus Hydrogenedentes bacterium]|nr:hypothetical protein [Candidatus Hydrogenedentota bacterium]